jgi:hypothetical protein
MKLNTSVHQIKLRIAKLSELFNSVDPTHFHHSNLEDYAEKFLETSAWHCFTNVTKSINATNTACIWVGPVALTRLKIIRSH